MRKRNKNWIENELEVNEKMIKQPEDFKGRWKDYFKNDNPIYLEIGCGKGRFATNSAIQNKNINFIAFDKELQIIAAAVKCCRETCENLNETANIGFIIGDVKNLESYFDIGEISRIYINFCDPWRTRHKWEKRRLTHTNFLKLYETLLNNNPEVFFKTDDSPLFEFSLNEFANNDWKLKNITLDLHNNDFHLSGKNIMTEYEEKFSSRGMQIFRCEARKTSQVTVD